MAVLELAADLEQTFLRSGSNSPSEKVDIDDFGRGVD
jgi:hypothetical protein